MEPLRLVNIAKQGAPESCVLAPLPGRDSESAIIYINAKADERLRAGVPRCGAGGGDRTHKSHKATADFKSAASTSSATPARDSSRF